MLKFETVCISLSLEKLAEQSAHMYKTFLITKHCHIEIKPFSIA